jgi:hypothetical protein
MNTKTRLAVSLANLPHGDYTFNSKIKTHLRMFSNGQQQDIVPLQKSSLATHCAKSSLI